MPRGVSSPSLRRRAKLFGLLGREDDYVLPWSCIVKVGSDIVLIEAKGEFMRRKRQHRLF